MSVFVYRSYQQQCADYETCPNRDPTSLVCDTRSIADGYCGIRKKKISELNKEGKNLASKVKET